MKARILKASFVIAICLACGAIRSAAAMGSAPSTSLDLAAVPASPLAVHLTSDSALRIRTPAESRPGTPYLPAPYGQPALIKPEGIDLDVTYINRFPMYKSYCVEYPEPWNGTVGIPRLCPGTEDEKRWPDPGEVVTLTAHIVNKGTVDSGSFAFKWFIDGNEVLSGTHPGLAPAAEGTAVYLWPWAHTMEGERVLDDHTVRFVVDPQDIISETYEGNNSLEDRTNALSLRITLTPEMYAAYDIPVTSTLPFSAEDWLQKQTAAMNEALALSIYPVTPQGATERVRLNAIVVAAASSSDERTHDGNWYLDTDVRDPGISFYTHEEDIDWGLIHELSHQIGLIDLYASMMDAYSVRVLDREGFPANFGFEWPRGGLMFGGDTAPHNNSHLYSSHSAGGISSTKGYRNNYFGAYQYDIPEHNGLLVLDNQGNPASDIQVALHQRSGPFNWIGLPEIDNNPEISGTTGVDGRLALANRDAHGGTTTRVGQTLRDNPFGLVDIVGTQNRFLLKLSVGEHVEFHWLDITSFNLAYWMGDTISHTFTITSHVPPSGAPVAPQMVTGRVAGSHATLSWNASPSPGVVGYRVYRATPPDYGYVLAGDLVTGTAFEEDMTDALPSGSTWLGHCVYAITAVDGSGLESGFSNLVYVPSHHTVRDVAVSSDGTRVVLDPWNPYPLFRQQYDGRYTHRLANPAYDLFDARFLSTDRADRLLVSDRSVRVFDRDAIPLFEFGGIGSGPGEFNVPTGITTWDGPCASGSPYEPDEHTLLLLHFDEDYSGTQGEPGTAAGTSFVEGHYGPGVQVDGSDTLTYTTAANLNRTAGTIEFWVRPNRDDDLGQVHVLFDLGQMDNGIQIVKHGGGNLHFLMWTPTNLTDIHARTSSWRAGEWHHVAAAWQGNHMALLIDGLLQAYSGTASPPEVLPDTFYVGSSPRGDWQADAVIDELRISDVPRPGDSGVCSRILVADSGNHRLQVFDALGNSISSYGGYGSGPGQFSDPQGLAVDIGGRVIVADRGNDRLQVLDFDGTSFSSPVIITAGLSQPTDVAAYDVGRIVVADRGNNAIRVLDAAGVLVATFTAPNDGCTGPFSEPQGVAIDAAGRIIVADGGNERVVTVRDALPTHRIWLPLASRQGGAEPAWNVSYVGQFGGRSTAAAVGDSRAYLGVGPRLVILDISLPAKPAVLGQTLPLPGLVRGLATGVGRVYVANDSAGLSVMSVSDPAHPFQIGLLDTPGQALGVTVGEGRAYVADGEAGLRVVNIDGPTRPVELGFYDTPGHAHGVAVGGRYAYVADGVAGLRVVDVANPSRPLEVGFYDTPGEAWGVAVAGGYAYVADRDGGLRVVDVSDPAHPVEVGSYDTPDWATSVAVDRGYAYVANGAIGAGLLVVDVTDPAHPRPAGSTTESSAAVVVSGSYAYAADWENGLRIVDISNPCQPRQVGFYHTSGSAVGVAVAGGRAYLSAWGGGLHIADVSDPAHIVESGSIEGQGWYKHAAVFQDYAYGACGWGGLRVVDIADPAHPTEVGVCITPGHAEDVALWSTDDPPGLYAAVANALEGLRVVDISDPAHPVEVGARDTPGQAFGVAVEGGYAYVADDEAGLRVLHVADPKHPVELGFCDTPMNAFDVAVAGAPSQSNQSQRSGRVYAYVADGGSGLRIVDISDSAHPVEVGFWNTPGPAISVMVRDAIPMARYAYVAAGDGGLRVVDISNPASPKEVGYYDTPGWAQEVVLAGDYIYLADDPGGLLILRFEESPQVTERPAAWFRDGLER